MSRTIFVACKNVTLISKTFKRLFILRHAI